jgi:hypothetical protein
MKPLFTLVSLLLLAQPALAHTGDHIHPHASDPAWLPVALGLLVVTGAAFAWLRK